VAACNKELTGVGPSIASGNQVCKPNWADLPTAPNNKKNEIKSNFKTVQFIITKLSFTRKGTKEKIT
tara:strand:+ start:8532 stop:8732 length:201 start_codon:yes stop_codon:yes gene_type:complete